MADETLIWTSNTVYAFWLIAGGIGLVLFVLGVVVFFSKKNYKKRIEVAALVEFLAFWILYIPFEYCSRYDGQHKILLLIHSVLISLVKTITKYLGDGYEYVYYVNRPTFSMLYSGLLAIVNIAMLVFMAGYIIKFIEGPFQRFKLLRNKGKCLCVFSEYNEKTLLIAQSLKKEMATCGIVFVCPEDELSDEQKHKVISLGGTVIFDDLPVVLTKYQKYTSQMKVFIFNNEEQDNLSIMGAVSERLFEISVVTNIFVELSQTPWSIYDAWMNNKVNSKVTVNIVRVEETYCYNNLLHNSIFANYVVQDGNKEIKILIVGINERNIEMLKTVLHLSQMPGYRPTIVVVDDKNRPGYIRKIMPDVKPECNKKGNAIYKFVYCGGIGHDSTDLEDLIEESHSDFTFAYINIGDDITNVNTALLLDTICQKKGRKQNYKIQVSVRDTAVCRQWDKDLIKNIQLTGADSDVYSYSFVSMSDIEKISKSIHEVREGERRIKAQQNAQEKSVPCNYRLTTWAEYCNNEYNRHSVYARTLSFRYKVKFIMEAGLDPAVTSQVDPWLIYEHMRWNMYMRTMGYTPANEEIKARIEVLNEQIANEADKEKVNQLKEKRQKLRAQAKMHEDIIDFDDLTPEDQSYDGLRLTPEIVKEFMSIHED